jgi:SRSO17 transposase
VIAALYAFVGPYLNGDDGIWVLEDIGFSKRGSKSVGVARQHNPTLDRKDNCQVEWRGSPGYPALSSAELD